MSGTARPRRRAPAAPAAWGALAALAALALASLTGVAFADVARGEGAGIALLAAAVAARVALALGLGALDEGAARRERVEARRSLADHLLAGRPEEATGAGDLLEAVDDAAQGPVLERLRAAAAASLVGLVVVALCAGWVALAVTVPLLAVAAPLYRRAGSRAEAAQLEVRARRERLEARQLEVLRHTPELRGLGAVGYGAREVTALSEREHRVALGAVRVALESSAVTEFLSGVSVGLVAMVVGFSLLDGRLSLARALVSVLVTGELYVQVRRYGVEFHRRENARAGRARLAGLGPLAPVGVSAAALVAEGLVTAVRPEPVDVELGPGATLLVTGPSGAGKTTLLETLLGWRHPEAGTVARGAGPVAVVSPTTGLLSGTLRENLALEGPIDDARLRATLDALGLDGPRFDDLDAAVLPDGRGLSTGERVRLLVARGLLAGARLFVLDDVAGVLDERARERVRLALEGEGVAVVEATAGRAVLAGHGARLELAP